MAIIIKKITVGHLGTNCYIAGCENSGFSFIIDPGDNPRAVIDCIYRNEFIPKGIILTHGHPDHTGGVKVIANQLKVPVMIHEQDSSLLNIAGILSAHRYLKDKDLLELGRESLKIIHTPGHTQGSLCILTNGILFSGDTLFKEGIGRTDLPGGSYKDLENSLKNKIFTLSADTVVYPGHGEETTIGAEMSK